MPRTCNAQSLRTHYSNVANLFDLHSCTVRNWHRDGVLCTRIARHLMNLEFDKLEDRERKAPKKLYPLYGKKQ